MISLENLKQFITFEQDFANSEYLAQATSLGSIFDTMMFPDYDNAINLMDVNKKIWQDLNFNYEFTENGYLFYHLLSDSDVYYDVIIRGTLTTEKGEIFLIDNRCNSRTASSIAFITFLIPVLKGMKLNINFIQCSKYEKNRISFLPLKEL